MLKVAKMLNTVLKIHIEAKKCLHQILAKVDGLHCIVLSDKEGVALIKVATDKAPELATRPAFLSTFGIVADHANKLRLGKTKYTTCLYSNYQVIQINEFPLVVTFIADINADTGYIYSLETQLQVLLRDLKEIVFE